MVEGTIIINDLSELKSDTSKEELKKKLERAKKSAKKLGEYIEKNESAREYYSTFFEPVA